MALIARCIRSTTIPRSPHSLRMVSREPKCRKWNRVRTLHMVTLAPGGRTEMRQYRTVGRCIVLGFGVIALAFACCWIFRLRNELDAIWGPSPLMAKAEKCVERGDFDSALKFANRAVRCRADFGKTYDVRAKVLEARGEFRESIQDYTKVVSLGYYLALADRGRVHEKMGELEKAATDYCEALRSDRTESRRSSVVRDVALHRVMGPGEYEIDRHTDPVGSLLKFFNEALEREPDNRDLRECRELILLSRSIDGCQPGRRAEKPLEGSP